MSKLVESHTYPHRLGWICQRRAGATSRECSST